MPYNRYITRFFFFFLTILFVTSSCTIYKDIQEMKKPKYEVGNQRGAKFCAECHEEIYEEWSANSRHAQATTAASFNDFKEMFTGVFMYKAMMGGEAMCYACHGIKEVNDGVNCETCHGTLLPAESIEDSIEVTHEQKYLPGREQMKKAEFCLKCHTMVNPMSGVPLMGLKASYLKSQAAAQGITCQDCHMKPRDSELRYHGFDTAVRNVEIYRGDLDIKDVALEFPNFSLSIENRVMGHSIPAGGGTRTLGLEISFIDNQGKRIHQIIKTFAKKYNQMPVFGLMPYKLLEDTQLQSGEVRRLEFKLPASLKGRIMEVVLTMKLYEVSDEHEGDISKAYWTSEPFFEKRMNFPIL